jgi:hypothetical protein
VSVLVTSDVSACGVDYPSVSHVVQVSIPVSTEAYVHRVGRTGHTSSGSGASGEKGSSVVEGRGDLVRRVPVIPPLLYICKLAMTTFEPLVVKIPTSPTRFFESQMLLFKPLPFSFPLRPFIFNQLSNPANNSFYLHLFCSEADGS